MKKLNWFEKLVKNSYGKNNKAKTIFSRLVLILMMFIPLDIFVLGLWLISKLP